KPSNIILNEYGNALLTDFGIIKLLNDSTSLTETGRFIGTPQYMAPEQWDTGKIDIRTDLYALGVIAYQLLTGQTPFTGDTAQLMYGHLMETPPSPQTLNPALSSSVEKALLKMLAKSPNERYQTATEFYTDLKAALLGQPQLPPETPITTVEEGPSHLSRQLWLGGIILVAVLSIISAWIVFNPYPPTLTPTPTLFIEEAKIEIEGQTANEDFQQIQCDSSQRIEIKLLDTTRTRIEPERFSYNWRFEPSSLNNDNILSSGNYAIIYQAPCELNNQTVTIEVQEDDKTLHTQSLHFNISD
ncbi:MAG: serine/threonine-protein kinase, partial [Chloroflexota bacterium]